MFVRFGISRDFQIAVDSEHLSNRHFHVRQTRLRSRISCESHCSSVTSARERETKFQARIGYRQPAANLGLAESSKVAEATQNQHKQSAETGRFQVVIGLNDLPQPGFGTPVATIGVGGMAFDQGPELRFYIGSVGIR